MISSWAYLSDGTFIQHPAPSRFKEILSDERNLLWVDLEDPGEEELSLLKDVFNFHPLFIEDCSNSRSNPKLDLVEDYLFLITHSCFYYQEKNEEQALSIRELDIFAGNNYVVTSHMGHIRSVSTNRKRCEGGCSTMEKGADFLLYNILDRLIDNYFPILDELNDRLLKIEEEIIKNPRPELQARMFALKRCILTLRKVIPPQLELIGRFTRPECRFVRKEYKPYFKDVYDHVLRIHQMTESARELITADMEAYLSAISFKLNDIMKTLTIIATIFIPLTFITGLYGMNFRYMPELTWKYGYLFSWGLISAAVGGLFIYFKKIKLI